MEVFTVRPKKQPKVVRKKLGKNHAWGQYLADSNTIEIDERVKGRRELVLYIHEYFHKLFPEMSEEDILVKSEHLAHFLWKHHFRKVDLSVK